VRNKEDYETKEAVTYAILHQDPRHAQEELYDALIKDSEQRVKDSKLRQQAMMF